MTAPHLPPDVPSDARPVRVVPLLADLGTVAGHRLTLLSLEVWPDFADLRFARVDAGAERPLPRRVPPPGAWTIAIDGRVAEVWDSVGRGDRDFSNGEVRIRPAPPAGARLSVTVELLPGSGSLTGEVTA
ncbi:MAG: hypothetical protein WEB09_09340 [Nitriliruptor sp.]